MNTTNISTHEHHHGHPNPPVEKVLVHVNRKPVELLGHEHTGLQIKEAAIKQHVKIEIDFLLYLILHHEPNQPIGDEEPIRVSHESHFRAIADDDNS
jgi:hypothetical protein